MVFRSILAEVPRSGIESKKPVKKSSEKLWADRSSEFYNKPFKFLLKNMKPNYILLIVI